MLQAENNEIVATSEMYTAKAGAKNGIEAVKRLAARAPINDTTDWETRRRVLGDETPGGAGPFRNYSSTGAESPPR